MPGGAMRNLCFNMPRKRQRPLYYMNDSPMTCWICAGQKWRIFKPSNLGEKISSEDFKITDARYGHTGQILQCLNCGFKQVSDIVEVLKFYETLEDLDYDLNRTERGLQARKIVEAISKYQPSGYLLDIGAATGILMEQAIKMGYTCEGVEPSKALTQLARAAGIEIHLGVFPNPKLKESYDLITLIDVIEHVPEPVELLKNIGAHLKPDGYGVLTTPNVSSLVARILGRRWWHFRIAHIGYFNRATIELALEKAGLESVEITSPSWYFTYQYAHERAMNYLPKLLRFKAPRMFWNKTVKVNFFDSIQVIFRRKDTANRN